MSNVIEKIEALHQRLEKARQIVTEGKVKPILGMPDHYTVESSTGEGHYLINSNCSCPDAQNRSELTKGLCKHKLAVLVYMETQAAATEAREKKAA